MGTPMKLLHVREATRRLLRTVLSSRYEHSNHHTVCSADVRITRYHARPVVASDERIVGETTESARQSEYNPPLPYGERSESVVQVLE